MTDLTADVPGPVHELVLHDGPDSLADLAVGLVRGAGRAGDPVLVVGDPGFVDRVVSATSDVPRVHAVPVPPGDRYPGREVRRFTDVLGALGADRSRVRVVNRMPPMTDDAWHEWRRYEAAANDFLAPYRVWGACAYDTSAVGPDRMDDLLASHSHVTTPSGRRESDRFADLDAHVRGYLDVPPHPVEATQPSLTLRDPSPAAARRAVRGLAAESGLSGDATDRAVLAVSEAVTNGMLHGRPPVGVRAWAQEGRVTVAVSDTGAGPHPLVGLTPVSHDGESGRGMSMLHQLIADVQHRTDAAGYTVRFTVDRDAPTAPG